MWPPFVSAMLESRDPVRSRARTRPARDQGEDRRVRSRDDPPHELLEVAREPVDRRRVEEVLVVLEVAAELAVIELQLERKVEPREADVDGNRAERLQPGQPEKLRRLDAGAEVDLKERVEAGIAANV